MTNPYSSPDPYSAVRYDGYWPHGAASANQSTPPRNLLVWAVLVFGLATYAVGCAAMPQPGDGGWGVRFSALAAVVAALGLLPRQSAHVKLLTALAVMGLLEALSQVIIGDQPPSWSAIVILVLNTLQALTALAALLAWLKAPGAVDHSLAPYDAYAYYTQAGQQYYYTACGQQMQQQPVQEQGTAQSQEGAGAQAPQSEGQRYALYAEYLDAQRPGASPAALSPQSGASPQTGQPAATPDTPGGGRADSVRPGYGAGEVSPTQSP